MTDTLKTFAANLGCAIRNREIVHIGGGEFTGDELREVLKTINDAIAWRYRIDAIREKIYDEHATGLDS